MNTAQASTETHAVDSVQLALNKKAARRSLAKNTLPYAGVVAVFLLFLITTNGGILTPTNLSNIVEQCFTLVIIAVGAAFIYSCGIMDISVGNIMVFAQLIMAYMMIGFQAPVWLLLLVGIGISICCTMVTALITVFLRVPTFIVSLCMMYMCTGIVSSAIAKAEIYTPYTQYSYMNALQVRLIALLAVVGLGVVLFYFTRLGRDAKAIGGNRAAAEQSGINYKKTVIKTFVCLGVCVGIAAFFGLIRLGTVQVSTGSSVGLNIMIAMVLGGFPLTGGANAKLQSAILGSLTITILSNGMALMGLDVTFTTFIRGVLFLLIIAISYERTKGRIVS